MVIRIVRQPKFVSHSAGNVKIEIVDRNPSGIAAIAHSPTILAERSVFGVKVGNPVSSSLTLEEFLLILEDVVSTGNLSLNKPPAFSNTGDSDVSLDATPSQYLIFRRLEPSVTEEILAKGAAKLYRPEDVTTVIASNGKISSTSSVANAGAQPGSIQRVLLVRDRRTNESWRYGFVEFATVEDAQAAVAKFNSVDKFTISSKPVLINYIHAGVFVPIVNHPAPGEINFTISASTNPALKIAYWDENAYVKELSTSTEELERSNSTALKHGTASNRKKVSEKVSKDSEHKKKRRKVEDATNGTVKNTLPSHLQFWTNRHAELHGIEPISAIIEPHSDKAKPKPNSNIDAIEQPHQHSFADPDKHCCYLCSRQFKSADEVNKHERLSILHQDNLKNEALKAKALTKLQKAGVPTTDPSQSESDYRDRAKERRTSFNQPKQAGFKPPTKTTSLSHTTGPSTSDPQPVSDSTVPSSPPTKSKGASLLGKMGWTAGSGLGAQGTGSTAPIATDLYAQGVGLGAEGGKLGDAVEEANRSTKGDYAEFASRTRDRARERFEKLEK